MCYVRMFLGLFALSWSAAAQAQPLYQISNALSVEAQPRLQTVWRAFTRYVARVDARSRASRHNAAGAYGSSFLAHNLVSNDLDLFVNVHLGPVRSSDSSRRDAASEILQRVRAYRDSAEALAKLEQQPAFALQHFMPEVRTDDQSLLEDLASSLRLAWKREPYLVTQLRRDITQLSELDAGLAYLPLLTNVTFLSNALEQAPGVFTGVRAVSVQVFFSVDLQVVGEPARTLSLSPLAPPRQVTKLWQQAYSGVFFDRASGELVASMLPTGVDPAELRLSYARGFLGSMNFQRSVRRYPIKFLKRLHLFVDALAPQLDEPERSQLFTLLHDNLHGDAAVLADQLKTQGEVLQKISEDPALLATFTRSGDIKRMLKFVAEASRSLRLRHPEISAELDLLDTLPLLIGEQPNMLPLTAAAIADIGFALVRKLSLDDAQMAELWQRASALVDSLGYTPVRAYAAADGSLSLRGADSECQLTGRHRPLRGDLEILSEYDPRLRLLCGLAQPDTLYLACRPDNARLTAAKQLLLEVQGVLRVSR